MSRSLIAFVSLAPAATEQDKGGQEEFGHYEVVPNWPQPLPDGPDGVKHDGWTWGSVGAVYAETPDRIWIAQRGELPLPAGGQTMDAVRAAQPVARQRHRQRRRPERHVRAGAKRGWERRCHHWSSSSIATARWCRTWPHHDKLFETPCGRGPHKIKMNPYDADKHVWVFDDQLHVI